MPRMNVSTKEANQVWASPDGQRVIYKLVLDYQGKPVSASTFSKVIATPGWSGEIETWEKPNNRGGTETFVKQPPKEGGYQGGSSGSQGGYKGGSGAKFQADPFTMYLSYAKDIIVAMIMADKLVPKTTYTDLIDKTLVGAYTLYQGRPEAGEAQAKVVTTVPDVVHEVSEEPVDLSLIDKVFSDDAEPQEELPWPEPKA